MVFSNESVLLSRLRAGEERAVQLWYESSKQKLAHFFHTRVKELADVDELVHDTYLSCLHSLPLFRGDSGLWSYMLSIARHELADYWRKKYAKRALALLPFGQEILESLEYEPTAADNSSIRGQKVRELQELLKLLPEEISELLQLKYVDGYSIEELALRYGLSFSAMQSRIYRAKELFKRELKRDASVLS